MGRPLEMNSDWVGEAYLLKGFKTPEIQDGKNYSTVLKYWVDFFSPLWRHTEVCGPSVDLIISCKKLQLHSDFE